MAQGLTLIENCKQLVTCDPNLGEGPLGIIPWGKLVLTGDKIKWVGGASDTSPTFKGEPLERIDAEGCVVTPGLIDPHTHLIFAGFREEEFSLKCSGQKSYAQLAKEGGGILSTVAATRAATLEELVDLGQRRLATALDFGITTMEIKSGYALETAGELKMLEAIARLDRAQPIDLLSTFLGAHEFPPEYRADKEAYINLVCEEMLPEVAKKKLARFCDVFCEEGVYTVEQSRRILQKAIELGLKLKLHADELAHSGGAALAAELGAVSADHLLYADDSDIEQMKEAGVVPVLLPGTSLFLNLGRYADARKMIAAGLPLALATDFNPGSSMTQSLPLILNLACTQMGMSAEEAFLAVTVNAAGALELSDRGQLVPDKLADLAFFDLPGGIQHLAYEFGGNNLCRVIKRGTCVHKRRLPHA